MKRRNFIKHMTVAGAALGAGTLAACSDKNSQTADSSKTQQKFNWRMATTWPPNLPIFQEGVERFAREIKKMSDGQLNIQVSAGGQLIPPLETFKAVSRGSVEMGHGAAYYWGGQIPAAPFFTAVPFGMNAQGMNAWLYSGGGLALWHKVYAPFNVVPFPMGNTGVQMGGWFRKKINSVADLKGLIMRIPGLGGKVMAKAGVSPVLKAGGEIYLALERKNIHATEWVGPYHDLLLKLHKAAEYYYYPGWHEPGPTLELTVNKKAWDSLPKDLQLMVETTAASINLWMLSEFEAKNLEALHTLQNKHKVQLLEFPPDVIKALHGYTKEVLEEGAKKDATFKEVYAAYKAFSEQYDSWGAISEAAYARARKL